MSRSTLLVPTLALFAACGGGAVTARPITTLAVPAAHPAPPSALDVRLEALTVLLRRAGATASDVSARGFLAGGETATVAVSVPAGSCATITTLASPGVRDIDATLFAPSGEVLAQDLAEDAHPTVQLCAPGPEARRAYVVIRAYRGAGAYVIATFPSQRPALAIVAAILGGTPGIASDTIDAVADDERLRDHALGAARRGFAPQGETRSVPLAANQSVWLPVAIGAAECVSVIALAERGLEDVDAQLLDADGSELVRDVGTGRDATVQYCAETAAELVLVLTAARGQGTARATVFAGPVTRVGGASGLWLGQPAAERVGTRSLDTGVADARAHALAANFRAGADGAASHRARGATRHQPPHATLLRGEAWRTATRLEARSCARFEVTPGPGIARPYLAVSADGVTLTEQEGRGGGEPAIAHLCTRTALDVEATVVARSGGGDVALSVSTRSSEALTDDAARAEALRLDESARVLAAGRDASPPELAPPGPRARVVVALEPSTCARVVFVADDASRVQLDAMRSARVVAQSTAQAPRVGLCAEASAASSFEVSAVRAAGGELRGTWLISRKRLR